MCVCACNASGGHLHMSIELPVQHYGADVSMYVNWQVYVPGHNFQSTSSSNILCGRFRCATPARSSVALKRRNVECAIFMRNWRLAERIFVNVRWHKLSTSPPSTHSTPQRMWRSDGNAVDRKTSAMWCADVFLHQF